ncbi:MAG: response regulator [Chloroflexi bacterium]|nr:response regulator [Chloroflexota bacterium]
MTNSLKILLAEDNEISQHLMVRILSRIGYEAVMVENGIKVLEKLDHGDFDVILMDIQMPEMDGLTATQIIRTRYPPERQPKIVAFTADSSIGEKGKYLNIGMDEVLTKPVQLDELMAILANYSSQNNAKRSGFSNQSLEEKSEVSKIFDQRVLMDFKLLMGDEGKEALAQLITLYKKDATSCIEKLKTAQSQLDIENLLKVAHTFKGCSSQVGAVELGNLIIGLEQKMKLTNIEDPQDSLLEIYEATVRLFGELDRFQAHVG